jgi:hypothetical protein
MHANLNDMSNYDEARCVKLLVPGSGMGPIRTKHYTLQAYNYTIIAVICNTVSQKHVSNTNTMVKDVRVNMTLTDYHIYADSIF